MNNVISFEKPKTQKRICSFCKKPEEQCKKFVASNTSNHCICGECIVKADQRLKEQNV